MNIFRKTVIQSDPKDRITYYIEFKEVNQLANSVFPNLNIIIFMVYSYLQLVKARMHVL